jgi:hypothetical protein
MRIMPTPVALLGIALLGGCAAAQSSSAAPRLEPDCSFRSASTCWTVAGRFPARRPKSAPSKPDELRDPSPTAVASKADSAHGLSHNRGRPGLGPAVYRSALSPNKRYMASSGWVRRADGIGGARDTSSQDSR